MSTWKTGKWQKSDESIHNLRYVEIVQQYSHDEWAEAIKQVALTIALDVDGMDKQMQQKVQQEIDCIVDAICQLSNLHEYTSLMRHVLGSAVAFVVLKRLVDPEMHRARVSNLTRVARNTVSLHARRILNQVFSGVGERTASTNL